MTTDIWRRQIQLSVETNKFPKLFGIIPDQMAIQNEKNSRPKKFSAEESVKSNAVFESEKGICGSRKGTKTLPHEHIYIFLDQEEACGGRTTKNCDELWRTRRSLETLMQIWEVKRRTLTTTDRLRRSPPFSGPIRVDAAAKVDGDGGCRGYTPRYDLAGLGDWPKT